MTRYFFDSTVDATFISDEIGVDCPDVECAKLEAARALAEIALDVVPGSERRVISIEVRDAEGPVLETSIVFEARLLRPN